ncbi:MAG: lipopolysaccharide heptosyltransferase II [Desulfobacteraceae bacterium]|nr:lipopolysaccharide heptosyltransferase II [Desulfobacteraceae bacterium]
MPKNILVVKLSAIGDVIHTLPALNAIRKQYPSTHITWLVEEAARSLVEGHEALDRVLVSKRKRWVKSLFSSKSRYSERMEALKQACVFIKELRNTHYDLVIDFQALLKSGVLIGLAKGERKAGFDKGMEHMEHSYLFLNERIKPVAMDNHAILRSMMLLDALGIETDEIEYKLPVREQDRKRVDDLLARYGAVESKGKKLLAALNPVAKWETKLWSNPKFAILADKLAEKYNARIVLTGGPEDRPVIQDIISRMKTHAVNLAGETTLKMLAALFEKTNFVVTTDTGPMHLAAAVGTPVVALFGPTAPWRTGPFGNNHQVIRAGLECSPCFKRQCSTTECMEQISVQNVMEGVEKIIQDFLTTEDTEYAQRTQRI